MSASIPPDLNPEIFREYDIRGLAEEDLPDAAAAAIGRAYGTTLARAGGKCFALGQDCRTHSPRVAKAFIDGATSAGVDVLEVGEVPTPVLYYSLFRLPVDGGVQVTASHNPGEYNGFKMCIGKESVHGPQVKELRRLAISGDLESGSGQVRREAGLIERYIAEWKSHGKGTEGLEVAVDGGNGMAGTVVPQLYAELGIKMHGLYLEPDGRFPNHEADPTQEHTLSDLKELVVNRGLRLGVAFDGDADRIGAVDHEGKVVWGDQLLLVYARDLLSRGPATVLCDVKCSDVLEDDIRERGGRLVMWKTGHSLIKAKMKDEKALLAGEMSGHMFFGEPYLGYDDAIYASIRLLSIVASSGKSLPELLSGLPPRVSTPELRVDCPEADKFRIVKEIADRLRPRYKSLDIDGIRYQIDGGWGLVRASNTQPVLVVRFEARDERRLAEVRSILETELATFGLSL